ncbi:MAG: DUF2156 domain-containing protein [Treponema sp.]|nr:DUF2156 domain-containing protein [Treponema sp.]
MPVPCYPDFSPINLDFRNEMHPGLSLTPDGVSEFTFSGLYLFRNKYKYRVSRDEQSRWFIISGEQPIVSEAPQPGKKFFMTPCGAPDYDVLESLFETHDYWKNISESVLSPVQEEVEKLGIEISEDRDNFDYLYLRKDLAELKGKKYHKKKNLLNQFLSAYPLHEQKPMTAALIPDAVEILDHWRQDKGGDGDYQAARESLEQFDSLCLRGAVFYADGKPVAYCLGESIARGKMFAVHFEKGIDEYKGIYQYMNQAFALSLPAFFIWINREQDIGDDGLRQAKTSYRPSGFVRKFKGIKNGERASL